MSGWKFTHDYSGNPLGAVWGVIRFMLFLSVALHIGWSPLFLTALIVSYVELTFSD